MPTTPNPDEVDEDLIEPKYTTLIIQKNVHGKSILNNFPIKGKENEKCSWTIMT